MTFSINNFVDQANGSKQITGPAATKQNKDGSALESIFDKIRDSLSKGQSVSSADAQTFQADKASYLGDLKKNGYSDSTTSQLAGQLGSTITQMFGASGKPFDPAQNIMQS
jgi:hypothetical protein